MELKDLSFLSKQEAADLYDDMEEFVPRSEIEQLVNTYEERIKELEAENRKLRYERMLWKSKYFTDGFGYVEWIHAKTKKSKAKYDAQAFRIGKSLEARAKKIKEGK